MRLVSLEWQVEVICYVRVQLLNSYRHSCTLILVALARAGHSRATAHVAASSCQGEQTGRGSTYTAPKSGKKSPKLGSHKTYQPKTGRCDLFGASLSALAPRSSGATKGNSLFRASPCTDDRGDLRPSRIPSGTRSMATMRTRREKNCPRRLAISGVSNSDVICSRLAPSHASNAAGMRQLRETYATQARARRAETRNRARCNSTLFTADRAANLEFCSPAAADVGLLGGAERTLACTHCSALLFKAESMPVPRRAGCVRGRSCCSNGDVVLPAVRELSPLRDMWRRDDAAARTIQKYARKF